MRATSSRVVYENRWMRVHEDRTELPDGSPGLYGWVEKPPAALIVPLEADAVWLIEQFRYPVGERFWEFPQGAWEDAARDAEALARGELAEETGLRAGAAGAPRPAVLRVRAEQPARRHLARDRARARRAALEHTEQGLVARRFARAEVERMMRANEIRDAASVAAWHLATR